MRKWNNLSLQLQKWKAILSNVIIWDTREG